MCCKHRTGRDKSRRPSYNTHDTMLMLQAFEMPAYYADHGRSTAQEVIVRTLARSR